MRVLIATGPTYGLIFPLVPLAWSLRSAGHEVLFAGPQNSASAVNMAGQAFIAASGPLDMMGAMTVDRSGEPVAFPHSDDEVFDFMGRGFGRLAAYTLDGLTGIAERWRPDVVVGSSFHFAASLLARHLGVPWVNHAVELSSLPLMEQAAQRELAQELGSLELAQLPAPDLFLDICPPGLRAPGPGVQSVRYVPYNTPSEVEAWMLERPTLPRLCVTLGSRVSRGKSGGLETLAQLTQTLAQLDVELLVAATPETAALLAPLPEGARAGWLPLDVVVPRCNLVVHHGGTSTMFNCLTAGVPQLVLPYMVNNRVSASLLSARGGAEVLEPGKDGMESILAACEKLLATHSYTAEARALSEEIAQMPTTAEVVHAIAGLVAG